MAIVKKDVQISVKVTPQEYEKIKAASDIDMVSLSAFVRKAAIEAAIGLLNQQEV